MLSRLAPFAADLWQHRDLLLQFTLRQVELRHKGSHLGLIWSLLNPLIMLVVYVLVFGYIFGGKFGIKADETRIDYGLGIFLGLVIFHLISEPVNSAPGLVVTNPNFVKKVVFPLEILPAASVASALFHVVISICLILIGLLIWGEGIPLGVIWLPVLIMPICFATLGLTWLVAGLGVYIRDLGQVLPAISMGLLFGSAVFYSAASIPAEGWLILRFNPVLLAIEEARNALLWARPVNLAHVAYLYAFGVVSCYIGHAAFRYMKPGFSDII